MLVAVIMFAAPAGTFSLTNFLGGRGNDFHASPGFVGLVGGLGVAAGGIVGCLVFPPLSRVMPLRPLYLAVGLAGALCTLGLILLPHTPAAYAIILITQNLFQSLAITTSIAVVLETIGRDNPLASTTFCFIASAYGVPISYMLYIDAFGFARGSGTAAAWHWTRSRACSRACCWALCWSGWLDGRRWRQSRIWPRSLCSFTDTPQLNSNTIWFRDRGKISQAALS